MSAGCWQHDFGVASILNKLLSWHQITSGYTDIIVAICFLCGCILASVGVLGRYLMMIVEQTRGRPGYIVMDQAAPGALSPQVNVYAAVS